jgi:mycothiol S-conjugate amidase
VPPRLLFVHAHPDDESSKGAATAARYVDAGAEVVLVTCTGGEAGEVLNDKVGPVAPQDMARVRAAELAAAVEAIGFTRTHALGFVDSGYHEDPTGIPPGTFAAVDLDEPARALAAILRRERPHVVVTYPEDGGYPHPDHIRVHAVAVRAADLAADPSADVEGPAWDVPRIVACTAFPMARVTALHEAMLERTGESPFTEWLEKRPETPRQELRDPVAVRVDVGEWFARRDAALLAHATQVDPDGFWFGVPRDLEREAFPHECFLAVRGVEPGAELTDLFDGLDVDDEAGVPPGDAG